MIAVADTRKLIRRRKVFSRSLFRARPQACVGDSTSTAGRQAIHPPGGVTEEQRLLCRRHVAEGRLNGGYHRSAVPQQVVDRIMRGEHASPGTEDAERRPYPFSDRTEGCSEYEGNSLQLQDDVRKLTHRREAFFPPGKPSAVSSTGQPAASNTKVVSEKAAMSSCVAGSWHGAPHRR